MAFYNGSTAIFPGLLPLPNQISAGSPLYNDGLNAYWAYPGESHTVVGGGLGGDWRYRTILTHGYQAAGYKGYSPWKTVNKTWHSTDTTYCCGEQLDRGGAYLDGCFSDLNAYVYGTSHTWAGSAAHTSSYSLSNGTRRTQNNDNFTAFGSGTAPYGYVSNNPAGEGLSYGDQGGLSNNPPTSPGTGGWGMSVNRANHGCASTQINNAGYTYGGGSAVTSKHHFPSEVMYTTTSSPVTWGATCATGGQYQAYIGGSSSSAYLYYMTYTNDSFSAWAWPSGVTTDGVNKALMSKYGWFYFGRDTNTSTSQYKFSESTRSVLSTLTKLGSFGEENYQMGQDWGYMVGNYNGQQNNWTVKYTYSNDTMATLGFGAQPKGHYGTSSGACSSAAASVTSMAR
jgi:hypothetical protein